MKNIRILDTTLRDGEQAPGVSFNADLKIQLLDLMYYAGIRDFEVGIPAVSSEERKSIKRMLSANFEGANLSVWCRARLDDLKMASDLGSKMVNLSLPVSDIQLSAIGKSTEWAIDQLHTCLEFANAHFDFVAIGAQDGSRCNKQFLYEYIAAAASYAKVKRIRVADTVGIMNPFSVYEMFHQLSNDFANLEFEFHGHNDLGMANANGLAAFKGGAQLVSGTLNGLGERCGNTPIEELVIALEHSEGIKLSIDKKKLRTACHLLSIVSGRKVHPSKPFNGEMCFTHESGIHTRSLLVNELAYQPYKSEETGGAIHFVFGKHSGSAAVKAVLAKHGIKASSIQIEKLVEEIKGSAAFSSSGLKEEAVLEYFNRLFKQEKVWAGVSETLLSNYYG